MVRTELTADDSLAAMRARSRFGMAIAAMIRMMATTISNSISEKPFCFRIWIYLTLPVNVSLIFSGAINFDQAGFVRCICRATLTTHTTRDPWNKMTLFSLRKQNASFSESDLMRARL